MNVVLVCHKYGVSLDDPCCFPLGLLYVSAALKQAGHGVKMLNYNLWDYDFAEEIKNADVVGFTGFEEFKPLIIRDSAVCRELGIKTMLGGALATFLPDEMLQYVDTVVAGEADEIMERALTETGIICGTKPNLDTLPPPDYEGFGIDEYNRRHPYRYLDVLTTRGCLYSCIFCAQTCHLQFRSMRDVFAEIDRYVELYHPRAIVFADNTLNLRKDRWHAICDGMKQRKLRWGAAIRADRWDDYMARKGRESGLQYVVVGVESFNQEKLDRMGKNLNVEQIHRCLESLDNHRIGYHGNILCGFPWESYDDVLDEIILIPRGVNVFPALVQPFVGTKCQTRKLTEDQCSLLDQVFRSYAETKNMNCYPGLIA